MQIRSFSHRIALALTLMVVLALAAATPGFSQKKKTVTISATAMGTSTQLGRVLNLDIYIYDFSTADDQKALLEAFGEKGSEGLANALDKMSSKGHIAVTGTLGFDLKYVRLFKLKDGTLSVRFVTDRPITFAEHWASARSMDYSLAVGELLVKKEKAKSSGTLVAAARLYLNKAGELELQALQNPWNLTNIRLSK